ncbi:MAG: TAXI family TRAP transporter solute-binding subunit [Xanthobacteraceae bacterium]
MKLTTAFAAACLAAAVFAGSAAAQSLGIGAGKQGSQNYATSAAMGKFLANELGLDVRVQSYGGAGQTLPLINSGRLDLALVPGPDYMAAALGQKPFEGHALGNLRILADMGPTYYGFMVRKDSDMHKVADAKGKTITYGYAAQPALRLQVDGILAAGGLSINDMQQDNVPSVPNGVDDLISGNAEVAYFAIQGGKAREADAAVGIRWLALEDTPENEAAMQKFVPMAYIDTVPAGAAPGLNQPTAMMAYDYLLVVGAHVPDDLVQKILKLVHDNPDKVKGLYKAFAGFSPEKMAPDFKNLKMHPAAIDYYKQVGLKK